MCIRVNLYIFENIYNFVIMYVMFFFIFIFDFNFLIFKEKVLNRLYIRVFVLVLFCIYVVNLFVYYMIFVFFI